MLCNKNKHKSIIQDYRKLIGEQAEIIKEQQKEIEKLKDDLKDIKTKFKSTIKIINVLLIFCFFFQKCDVGHHLDNQHGFFWPPCLRGK